MASFDLLPEKWAIHKDISPVKCVGLSIDIGGFREMKMQPSLERTLRHKEILKA